MSALVRLGKAIHYEASRRGLLENATPQDAMGVADQTSAVSQNWPTDIATSRYWTSQGQSEIKFNEGLVRVWRHTVAIASRTLVDWADPKRRVEAPNVDILLEGAIKNALGDYFDADGYAHKVPLLFGKRSDLFENGSDEFRKEVLRFALEGLAGLRHNSFHFKGLGSFVDAFVQLTPSTSQRCLDAVRILWKEDRTSRAQQLVETMSAAGFDYFFDSSQAQRLAEALSGLDAGTIPLPRFNRLLERAQNAWSEGDTGLGFPSPANRVALGNPALLCQYTALKLLYEHAFRAWLQLCSPSVLNNFIARAIARTTNAARELNAADDLDWRDLIVARAAHLGSLGDDDGIETFFFNLSAETASEMRVQRGYESDADKA
ncbi:MAG: type VI-A CRISPR-associated RNA-guided ribonuclease Cas13a, partial [bacterium]